VTFSAVAAIHMEAVHTLGVGRVVPPLAPFAGPHTMEIKRISKDRDVALVSFRTIGPEKHEVGVERRLDIWTRAQGEELIA
jgi:hypothetical protein